MTSKEPRRDSRRPWLAPAIILGATVLVAAVLVSFSLRKPPLDTFTPTPPSPAEVGRVLVGPLTYTVDASATGPWVAFDFSRGSAVPAGDQGGWDIAFRRFDVMTNGGSGFGGRAGIVDLGAVAFDSVRIAPEAGYVGSESKDSTNTAIERWYDYGFTSHILSSKRHVYAVRTADGRYAKLQILSYYCPGAVPGCVTFRYVYQGDGSRHLAELPAGPGTDPAG